MKYPVYLQPDTEDGGFTVTCPVLPGCVSQGDTREEALANIKEAIEGYLQVLRESGEPAPEPGEVTDVEVPPASDAA